MNTLKTAVIGTGYLGRYHVEKFANLPASKLIAICDIDLQHTHELSEKFNIPATNRYQSLLGKVEAVSIATSTPSHFEIAKFFLDNGVHVFVEKPMTTEINEATTLTQLAKKNNLVLQVGHIERFNPAFKYARGCIHIPRYIESHRLTSFQLRGSDVSVILDLMIHDIDLILSVTQSPIKEIRAIGASVLTPFIDIANARIEFNSGCVASITASRIHSKATRRLRIFQNDSFLSIDLQNNSCRVSKKDEGEMFSGIPNIQTNDIVLEKGDALNDELTSFLDVILNHKKPLVGGQDALHALTIATEITKIVTENTASYV